MKIGRSEALLILAVSFVITWNSFVDHDIPITTCLVRPIRGQLGRRLPLVGGGGQEGLLMVQIPLNLATIRAEASKKQAGWLRRTLGRS